MSGKKPSISEKLLACLPKTLVPLFTEKLGRWHLLFPAERRQIGSALDYLSRLSSSDLLQLFAPLRQVEAQMELGRWQANRRELAVNEVSRLARSPYYSQWRNEVDTVVAKINDHTGKSDAARANNRMVLCLLPAGLPLKDTLFPPALARKGRWVSLRQPFARVADDLVASLAARDVIPGVEQIEHTWIIESGSRVARALTGTTATVLSYELLDAARQEFRKRLNAISKDLRSLDETYDELRGLKLGRLLESDWGAEPEIREFVRDLFLSGNGAVVFNNSFVQWGASEALRRVQPQVLVCCFGIRQRLKPFSSLVPFEDQNRANPVPDQGDPTGSLVDIQVLCEYVRLAAECLPPYRNRTLYVFTAAELSLLLLLAPTDLSGVSDDPGRELDYSRFKDWTLDWLARAS